MSSLLEGPAQWLCPARTPLDSGPARGEALGTVLGGRGRVVGPNTATRRRGTEGRGCLGRVRGEGWESPREQMALWLRLASPCRTGHCTPVCPAPPTRSCGQGPGHTTRTESRQPPHRSSNTGPRGSPTGRAQKPGHRSLLAGGPAGPLTMMASACLASSSETALRKPLGCGAAGLEVGMVPARSRALLRSPLPGGLLKAEPTSQPLRVPHLPPPRLRPPSCLWPPAGGRRGGRGEREARGRALSH